MNFLKKIVKKILYWEARLILAKYKPKIISITGSVGKTSTKEALYLVMAKNFFVRKSEKSFTADLGIPLTIIGCPIRSKNYLHWICNILFGLKLIIWKNSYPKWLILEVDGDKPGDLTTISKLIKPDILILTAIGEAPSHVELFSDLENLIKEKKKIIDSLKRDGFLVYNADDSQSLQLAEYSSNKKISCSLSSSGDITGSNHEIVYDEQNNIPIGMKFNIISADKLYKVEISKTIGINNQYAYLLAFAVGRELELPENKIVISLNKYKSLPGRMNILPGIKETVIFDDSYNSSPAALDQAIAVFSKIKTKSRKIFVIGDMLELGKYSAEEHRKSAHKIKKVANIIICVGIRTRLIANELLSLKFSESKIIQTDTSNEAGLELQKIIKKGDVILIKGSQAMRMEKVVEEIMLFPQDKEKLLVRQELKWTDE